MAFAEYEKYSKFYDGTYVALYDCSSEVPHAAIGIWKGFFRMSDPVFLDEMRCSLDFIHQYQVVTMISDHSQLKVVSSDVLDWLHTNWYPTAAKHGLRIEAALDAESATAHLSLKRMLDKAKTGRVATPVFKDFHAAYCFCRSFLQEYDSI